MQEPLARNLRVLRAERGITLEEAAQLTGVTRETLGALEHGQRAAYTSTLHKIAEGYDTMVSALLEEEAPKGATPKKSGRREVTGAVGIPSAEAIGEMIDIRVEKAVLERYL